MIKHGETVFIVRSEDFIYGVYKYKEDAETFKKIIKEKLKNIYKIDVDDIIIEISTIYEIVDLRNLKDMIK